MGPQSFLSESCDSDWRNKTSQYKHRQTHGAWWDKMWMNSRHGLHSLHLLQFSHLTYVDPFSSLQTIKDCVSITINALHSHSFIATSTTSFLNPSYDRDLFQ